MTLKEIKKRVKMMLDEYSENGAIISSADILYADVDLKFNDACDIVQRKIALTGRKLTNKIPLILKKPKLTAPPDFAQSGIAIAAGVRAYVYIPASTRTFSFIMDTETAARPGTELYYFTAGAPAKAYTYGHFYDESILPINFSGAVRIDSGTRIITPPYARSEVNGYTTGVLGASYYMFIIRCDASFDSVYSNFAAYADNYAEPALIPPYGYARTYIPKDIIEINSVEREGGSVNEDALGFDLNANLLTAPVSAEGIYYITYTRYPKVIDSETAETAAVELSGFAADALVYGIASLICPAENVAAIAKLNSLFDEVMRNLYNTERDIRTVRNTVFTAVSRIVPKQQNPG